MLCEKDATFLVVLGRLGCWGFCDSFVFLQYLELAELRVENNLVRLPELRGVRKSPLRCGFSGQWVAWRASKEALSFLSLLSSIPLADRSRGV